MTNPLMPSIESLRVLPVELTHTPGKISVHRLHQQMIVVDHLAVGMHHPIEASANTNQHLQPDHPVIIV